MAFNGNLFALLRDDDDGDTSPLILPPHIDPESNPPAKPHDVTSERERGRGRGRVHSGRGSGRNSWTDVESLGQDQHYGIQKNQERESNYYQSHGYRRYNGQSDGYRQHRGRGRGRSNGYQQQNRLDGGNRKNDVQNSGTEQGEWHAVGGGGTQRRFYEKNGFANQDQVLDDNQQNETKCVEKESGGNQAEAELIGDKSHSDVNQFVKRRWSSSGERRGHRGSNGGNRDNGDNSFARRENGEVKVSERKETIGRNKELIDSAEEHNSMEGKVVAEVFKEGDAKQNGQEVPTGKISKEELVKEIENNKITLREYEKQLREKRKTLEALKTEERIVTLDKDFESMQIVGRKKDDCPLVDQHSDKGRPKKDDSLGKDEKLQKVCGAITRAWYRVPRRGRGEGVYGHGGNSSAANPAADDKAPETTADSHKIPVQNPCVEDLHQFPSLG